jgi:prepilin-type N-terminal cleavage/methylation domain-containing protein
MHLGKDTHSAFTLIELLVVIAIIAILAVVVVLVLNPAELLRQSRDANRISDLATMNSAVNLYNTDQAGASGYSLGASSTSYLSVPDPTATSTDPCTGLGMPASSYAYRCSASSTYRMITNQGWIPVNLGGISAGSPISSLPVDPVNQTSSGLYYTYSTNGNQYAITAFLESTKYAGQSTVYAGVDPALAAVGSGASILPNTGRGLVGYWPLNEGTGSSTIDWSGSNDTGTWSGAATGTSGYYSPGNVWNWAGAFDGTSTQVSITIPNVGTTATYLLWLYPTVSVGGAPGFLITHWTLFSDWNNRVAIYCGTGCIGTNVNSLPPNVWTFAAITENNGSVVMYINGVQQTSSNSAPTSTGSGLASIGRGGGGPPYFQGYLSDVRVYNRVLSGSEIQEIYNAEK